MTRTEIARIKKMLTGPLGKRLDKANAARVDRPRRLTNKDSRRAAARLLAPTLDRATAREFAGLVAADQARLEAASNKLRAEAVRASRDNQRTLKAAAVQLVNGWQQLVQIPGQIGHEVLNKPFLIWPTNSVDLEASEIIPVNSFAKFRTRVDDGDDFIGDVKFFYLWRNPKDTVAVINVTGFVIFNGHCFIGVGGGIFPADRRASVTVEGRLDVLEWFNQPPTSPPQQPDQRVTALTMSEEADGFGEVGAVDAKDIFRGFGLTATQVIVPPSAVMVFVVVAAVTCNTGEDDSIAEADFASGAFQVGSPAVLIATLS